MLNPSTIAQLNRALESSFAAIKHDMNELKLSLSSQAERNAAVLKELETVKAESVTKDKLNVLKIKLGELNEGLKKVWDLEKLLKTGPNATAYKSLQQNIDELNAKLIGTNLKLNELNKSSVSETQLKALLTQINAELNKLASNIRDAEVRRDELRRQDIEQHTQKIVQKITATNNDVEELRNELKSYVDKDEVKKLLDDLNSEFDGVKKEISSLYKRDAAYVRDGEVKSLIKNINKEFDGVAQELASLKKQSKDYVTAGQIKGLVDDISDEFNDLRDDIAKINPAKELDALRKTFGDLQKEVKKVDAKSVSKEQFSKELKQFDKELSKTSASATYGASVVLQPAKKVTYEKQRKKYVFGNFLIFVSFLSLIASIISYTIGEQLLMDNFAIGAVIIFIIGMILRIYAVVKSSKV